MTNPLPLHHNIGSTVGSDPSQQWWYRFSVTWVAFIEIGIGVGLICGPERWTTSRSLSIARDYSHIPWPIVGSIWILCAIGLVHQRTRPAAYIAGAGLASVFVALSVAFSLLTQNSVTSIVTIGLAGLSPLMLIAGYRWALAHSKGKQL